MPIKDVIFDPVSAQDIKLLLKETSTLVITSINYEERSMKWLSELSNNEKGAFFKIIILRGMRNNVSLLENIKDGNVDSMKRRLASFGIPHDFVRINYPSGFDTGLTRQIICSMCKEIYSGSTLNVIFEITSFPRALIFCILHSLYELKRQGIPLQLYVVYTTALSYPRIEAPHETGAIKTYYNDKYLREFLKDGDRLNLLLTPSIYGSEIRLLMEELKGIDLRAVNLHLLIPLYKHDVSTGLRILRMSSDMLLYIYSAYNAQLNFSFSIEDSMKMVLNLSDWEEKDVKCLIAPFNIKPLAVSAFYAYIRLLEKKINDVDILRMSTVHYGSLYSLGAGETYFWRVNIDERENKDLQSK